MIESGASIFFTKGCGRCKLFDTPKCKVFRWEKEMALLRKILLESGLKEEVKWKHPCYTFEGRNIVLLNSTNHYCALGFFKGVLMKDEEKILVSQTENMQSVRQFRATNVAAIKRLKPVLLSYLAEAIAIEKAGTKVALKKATDYPLPEELEACFNENPGFKKAFQQLTPGRQKGYLFFFNQAKQAATRTARIEKYRTKILNGLGMND